ncbi:MAG: general secretion pathway protein GspK [Acidobacteria bacterium]|nr:general secretion pathway protein GspK [Acidobacteriota bacterium]
MWTLIILSAIALTYAASVGTEIRASQESWNDLQAERLAKSGYELAAYLETRSLGTTLEDLTELPVEPLVAGLSYRVAFDIGSIELILEGENRKLDLASAGEDVTEGFFTVWTGNPERSREIAAAIADWMDPNDDPRDRGAESATYAGRGYSPRNAGLGSADLFLVRGLTPEDFAPAVIELQDAPGVRNPLPSFIAETRTGNAVNPNYASGIVLQSLPGMTQGILGSILEMRRNSIFTSTEDFRKRAGLPSDSPFLKHFTFDRGTAPAILALARLHNSSKTRSERRTRMQIINPGRVPVRFVGLIERNMPPQ